MAYINGCERGTFVTGFLLKEASQSSFLKLLLNDSRGDKVETSLYLIKLTQKEEEEAEKNKERHPTDKK